MGQFFVIIYKFFERKKFLLFLLIGLSLFLLFFSLDKLSTEEDFSQLFPNEKKFEDYNRFIENSSLGNKIIVLFSARDSLSNDKTDLLIKSAGGFLRDLKVANPKEVVSVEGQISNEDLLSGYYFFYDHLPLFLDSADYRKIEKKLADTAVASSLRKDLELLVSPAGIAMKHFLLKDPLGFTYIVFDKLRKYKLGEGFTLVRNWIFSKDKNNLFVFLTIDKATDTRKVEELRGLMEDIIRRHNTPEVQVYFYGAPLVAMANAERIKKDIMLTVSITLLFIFLFLGWHFRSLHFLFVLFLPVVVGASVALTVLYFLRGEISAISLGIGSVLLGISVDYSLHYLSHARHAASKEALLRKIASPLLLSSITTASAFLCLLVVDSDMLRDLGIFASVGVVTAAIAALVILPVLTPSPTSTAGKFRDKNYLLSRMAAQDYEKKRYLLFLVSLLTVVFFFTGKRTSFDRNLMHMNYLPEDLSRAEDIINRNSTIARSTMFLITSGKTTEEALAHSERIREKLDSLERSGLIKEYHSVNELIPSQEIQAGKIELWNRFWRHRKDSLQKLILREAVPLGYKKSAFSPFFHWLDKAYHPIPADQFFDMANRYMPDHLLHGKEYAATVSLIKVDHSRRAALGRFFEKDSKVILFDKQGVAEKLFGIILDKFHQLLLLSSLTVFLILLISFGRIELALITFLPIVFSWIWTVGIMGVAGIQFNIFNIIISSFIFGLGVDYSIFITKGVLNNRLDGMDETKHYRLSVLLSAITTLVGMGVLILAKHPALRSIAAVSVIGISSAVVISFVLLPAMVNFLFLYRGRRRSLPVTFVDFFFSIASLIYFVFATLLFSFLFLPFLWIFPARRRFKQQMVHYGIWFFSWTVVYMNIHVPKILEDVGWKTFRTPRFVISNHQSTLDLVFLLMLHPRIVILSNQKAIHNFFYGPVIRAAGFIPSASGIDEIVEQVREKMAEGYSVIIFPEGTRSPDCKIKRFHKGAFYIAEQLGIEILPLMLHGACQAMNKKEFFLRRGIVHIKALPAIDLQKGDYGRDYREYAKAVRALYRKEFEKLNRRVWVPDRMKHNLVNRYLYRGPVLEWYLRVKLRLEENYNFFHSIIPYDAIVTDLGCGYGFIATMLALTSGERSITGVDYDERKIRTARRCTEDLPNLSFLNASLPEYDIPESDVILLIDVLHYLARNKQVALIKKAIQALSPQGIVIFRDADAALKKRTFVTKMTEWFSTGTGFNKNTEPLEYVSGDLLAEAAREEGMRVEKIDNTKWTSNITYILRK